MDPTQSTTRNGSPRMHTRRRAMLACAVILLGVVAVGWASRSGREIRYEPAAEFGEPVILLDVNCDGHVQLPALDNIGEDAVLTNPKRVQSYLNRRFREEGMAGRRDAPALVVVGADEGVSFGKVYPVLNVARDAGFERIQLRSARVAPVGERLAVTDRYASRSARYWVRVPLGEAAAVPRAFVLRVTATDTGTIHESMLVGEAKGRPRINFGRDLNAGTAELRRLIGWATLEIDNRLLQVHVIELLEMLSSAGFSDIVPVPLDPAER